MKIKIQYYIYRAYLCIRKKIIKPKKGSEDFIY